MRNHRSTDVPPPATAGTIEEDVSGQGKRSVGAIRDEFGSAVAGLKQKYGLLLEERDRRIKHLVMRLMPGPPHESKRRVLIVDDTESTAEIIRRHLEGHLVEVVHVTPPHAPEAVGLHRYAVTMIEAACAIGPHVDGVAFCRQLCDSGDHGAVVLMSSRPGDRVKDSAEEAGAVFLRKPFRRAQLIEIMGGTPAT